MKPDPQKVLSQLGNKYQRFRLKSDEPVLDQAIFLILQKDIPAETAIAAMEKMRKDLVDWNELRVSQIPEIARLLSSLKKDTGMIQKAQTLREFINQAFNIRHTLNLEPLREESREKQEKFWVSLECLDQYQIQALLMSLSKTDDVPYNPAIGRVLQRIGLISKSSSVAKLRSEVNSLVSSKDYLNFFSLLHRHADELCGPRSPLCTQCNLLSLCKYGKTQAASSSVSS